MYIDQTGVTGSAFGFGVSFIFLVIFGYVYLFDQNFKTFISVAAAATQCRRTSTPLVRGYWPIVYFGANLRQLSEETLGS